MAVVPCRTGRLTLETGLVRCASGCPFAPAMTGRVVDSPIWLPRGPIAVIVHRPLGGGLVASFAITGSSVCNSHVGRISTSRCYSDEGMKTERLK